MKMLANLVTLSVLGAFTCSTFAQAPDKPRVEKPAIVSASEWGSKPKPIGDERKHMPKYLTIHHAGVVWKPGDDPAAKVRGLQGYGQREKNWPDLPYHFLIAPDGRIFEGRPVEYEPESNTKYELKGNVGVELFGNFEQQRVNEKQLESLAKLCAWLCDVHGIDPKQPNAIRAHKDVAQTACPGKDFYRYVKDGDVGRWVAGMLEGKAVKVEVKEGLPGGPEEFIKP